MEFRTTKKFNKKELETLFKSVNWKSGRHPKALKKAMKNSDTVISVWEDGELVGLMNAISDKAMVVHFPYLLVRPAYQGKGIGKMLVEKMLEKYKGYFRLSLSCYDDKLKFYEKLGFSTDEGRLSLTIERES